MAGLDYNVFTFVSPAELAEKAPSIIAGRINEAASRGECVMAISGGNSPLPVFERIASGASDVPAVNWDRVYLFWSDERFVDTGSDESNYGNAYRSFISKIDIPGDHI